MDWEFRDELSVIMHAVGFPFNLQRCREPELAWVEAGS